MDGRRVSATAYQAGSDDDGSTVSSDTDQDTILHANEGYGSYSEYSDDLLSEAEGVLEDVSVSDTKRSKAKKGESIRVCYFHYL